MSGHHEVNSFLNRDEQSFTYRNFNYIRDARNFANTYQGLKEGFSLNITASGTGRNSHVYIQKTRQYFDSFHLKQRELMHEEIKNIHSYLMRVAVDENNNTNETRLQI